ncbi:putative TIR domain, P-loop containing nucleoside triphosphate hydrolase [Helianthus annuus]|nr:putative TIR domain, P-loop containing nucleoside triphosphate hydrolase [Helianthus annuus]KAJ0801890.1 putative TIR domain, P-loop containing nucleoside triphosphate hydrolase [Helianthus annuus]
MASTSASSIQKSFKYDVFLSFRGEDTRKNFVDHLHHALKQKSINAYKDDENIKKGERITDELIRSIEDSKFYIIVFSKNYASSSWCLDELVNIMDCQKTNEHTAFPVFYDVEPTEVRKQSGPVEKAFEKHKEDESAEKWKKALREAADLAGWELKNTFDGHEAKLIQKIVQEISLERRSINPSVDEKLVGMETRVEDVVSSLEIDVEDVRMIGIWGMGGAGKTTLAGAVFDQISFRFDGLSFVENVREFSKGSLCGLRSLQKQVLSDVTKDTKITVNSVHEGKNMMKQRMCDKKVLLVLDDVDHVDQLQALAGELDWFKPGSRVIITTRDKQVLKAHRVNLILGVNLLLHNEAIRLFSRYAFGTEIPIQGYEELSERVVCYANGLPLSIKVLGSFLCGKAELEWADALERLKTIPMKETQDILELSYQSLDHDYKEIFLDVACILKGREKEEAIRALESCGFHARIGLRVLEQKSLITFRSKYLWEMDHKFWGLYDLTSIIDVPKEGELLSMHDHIEEMGKNIVRRFHPNKPYRHSRMWNEEEIEDILVEEKGTEATRCIKVRKVDPIIVMKGLRKMTELRFLDVICEGANGYDDLVYKDIDEDSMYLPNGLQYLSWAYYPFRCLPKNFNANNLVGLKMYVSNIYQLWDVGERKVPKKLRYIDLCYCKLRTLDIGLLLNLEWLKLEVCDLAELDIAGEKPKLKHLSLKCSKLKTLNLKGTRYLESLNLDCEDLVELQMPIDFFKLKSLNLSYSKLRALDIGPARNLHTLNFYSNKNLVELHLPVKKLKHLRLSMNKYSSLEKSERHEDLLELHMPIESPELKIIYLCSEMKNLNLTATLNHGKLGFVQCEDLLELHNPIESTELKIIYIRCQMSYLNLMLTYNLDSLILLQDNHLRELHMPIEFPELKIINIRCYKLETLNLTGAQNLERLDLDCEDLLELRMPILSPKLKIIYFGFSKLRTLNLTGAENLERLDLLECKDLLELRMPILSPKLKIIYFGFSKLRTLNLTGVENLERLDLLECKDFLELHFPLENLKHLRLVHYKLRTLNLTGARYLERLDLVERQDLLELHLPVENLKHLRLVCFKLRTLNLTGAGNLEGLDLLECQDLLQLHMPIESPKLKNIYIWCSKLRTLNITGARNLERLDLVGCQDLLELFMPVESPKLKIIHVRHSKLRTLYLGLSPCLERLDLDDCFNLVEIHAPIGCGCVKFKPLLVDQGFPMIGSSAELHLSVSPFGICALHPDNNSPKFHFECIYKDFLPSSSQNLGKLISFGICACTNLAGLSRSVCSLQCLKKLTMEGSIPEVPEELGQLECLKELTLLKTNIEHLPDSICTLKHLEFLHLESCQFLKKLPEDLGRLERLEELHLKDCKSLLNIPNSICEMKRLKCFHLIRCIRVVKLPKEIGRLPCLIDTYIEGTGIIDPPESLFKLKGQMLFFP